ncbi:mitochondrial glycoprotein [Mycena rebaudengoi]|nr:mitochondrial glycoprotein [Mycena rebaudengoi]
MSAARTLRQLTAASSRLATRPATSTCLSRLPLVAKKSAQVQITRAFSASARSLKAGSSDILLVQKLAEELEYEHSAKAPKEPDFLNIRLMFSIADLQNQDPDDEYPEREEEEDGEEDSPVPRGDILRALVSITKSTGKGALDIEMTVQGGQFLVENIAFYRDASEGQDLSVEADWKRRGLYIGPQFSTLDVSVQEQFEKFLEERDIGESTALFIPDYAQFKEQKEYLKWLQDTQKFVEA